MGERLIRAAAKAAPKYRLIAFVSWSEQHLAFCDTIMKSKTYYFENYMRATMAPGFFFPYSPINYCSLSMACVHDSRSVCATSPDGCSRRKFLDQCDMFEYNCDYNAHYEMVECEIPNNSENVELCTPEASKLHTTAMKDYFYSVYKVKDSFFDIVVEDLNVTSEAPSNVEILKEFTSVELQESTIQESTCKTNCKRPRSWATTVKGETRDFFRILQASEETNKHV
ncbi:hypothetical protein RR48_05339 [Papilio machaon]|uniref:Uncharacterized protein n=1 Tax=Papilio machaon TaxID=76193 RepID=A0A0N0PD60_PAPMA|nr:hypothetical protein RR48_05339 [Papilio machaon]